MRATDGDQIHADPKEGVSTVAIPKKADAPTKSIAVEDGPRS